MFLYIVCTTEGAGEDVEAEHIIKNKKTTSGPVLFRWNYKLMKFLGLKVKTISLK